MNSGHTCFLHKGLCMVYFGDKNKNTFTFPHSIQQKHEFMGEFKKCQKQRNLQIGRKMAF